MLNKSFEEKEEIFIDLFQKSMYKLIIEMSTGKKINTEKEFIDAFAKMDGVTEVEFDNLKEVILHTVEELNKKEDNHITYQEYVEEQLSALLEANNGILDVTIENEQGEKSYYKSIIYDSEQKIAAATGLITELGKYKVTVKVANTGIVLEGEIDTGKEYEVELVASSKAYLKDKNSGKKDIIKNAYIYINNEKKDVSSYLKKDMANDDYLDYISLYYDEVTNMEVPFDIELISKYDTSARITITEPPVH